VVARMTTSRYSKPAKTPSPTSNANLLNLIPKRMRDVNSPSIVSREDRQIEP